MNTSNPQVAVEKGPSVAADLARGALWLIWQAVRFPVFAFLVILEPIIRVRPDSRRASRHPDVLLLQVCRCFAAFSVLGHAWFFGELRPSPDAVLRCHPPAVEVDRRVSISAPWAFCTPSLKGCVITPHSLMTVACSGDMEQWKAVRRGNHFRLRTNYLRDSVRFGGSTSLCMQLGVMRHLSSGASRPTVMRRDGMSSRLHRFTSPISETQNFFARSDVASTTRAHGVPPGTASTGLGSHPPLSIVELASNNCFCTPSGRAPR